ncbi:hypothetical protein OG689_43835 [Kitasatospora sp. NBC_00240]|uniref:hypothetical protein n=1 Tax=Kitasatospora sp. NBC_00240 TaxID=2903567 RepID=UPI002250D5ED|nr:hypothetical protein [Kitasatospora sp. NBC_00240]MCX5207729.1 hypothetical protein [Kitasatospora sp. NBC_00240]MCX5215372.1 hypothetical protein [Kitasatospora sp. NBC_00240]MCX5216067.1 hypothetical protein [Kitasatospora sp. NBC_00240]
MPATKDRTRPSRAASRPFTLWREVLTAYAAPALTAGTAGALTGQPDLTLAAATSIAGTSAVVALLVGTWLRRGGRPRPWTTALPRLVLTALLVVATAGTAAAAGWFAAQWLPAHTPLATALWLQRLRIDLPVSAALATAVITLRWRSTLAAPRT